MDVPFDFDSFLEVFPSLVAGRLVVEPLKHAVVLSGDVLLLPFSKGGMLRN